MVGLIFEDAADGAKAYPMEKIIKLITKEWNYEWQMTLNTNVTQASISEQEDKKWTEIINEGKEKNKIEKLEAYVSAGENIHLEQAKKMFEGLLWSNISRPKYVEMYVQHFPAGKYIDQVEDKVYRSSIPAFYIKLFPKGKYSDQVEEKLWNEALRLEANFKASGYEDYLESFPTGKHSDAAREKIKKYKL